MISPILSRFTGTIDSAFSSLENANATWQTSVINAQHAAPRAGTLRNLIVQSSAPAAGTTWTFTLMKNGAATSLSVTVTDTVQLVSDTDPTHAVDYVAGDFLAIRSTSSAGAASVNGSWCIDDVASNQMLIGASQSTNPSQTTPSYAALTASAWVSASGAGAQTIVPTDGVLSRLNVYGTIGYTATKYQTVTLVKNGVDTALQVVKTALGLMVDSTNQVSVSAGDIVYLRCTPTGAPTAGRVLASLIFTPTTDGESIHGGSTSTALTTGTTPVFVGPNTIGTNTAEATSSSVTNGTPYVLRKLRVVLDTAPGTGKSRTWTIRSNLASTTVTAVISDLATTAADTSHDALASATVGSRMGVQEVAAGTPAAALATWAWVAYAKSVSYTAAVAGGGTLVTAGNTKKGLTTAVATGGGVLLTVGRKATQVTVAVAGGGTLVVAALKRATQTLGLSGGGALVTAGQKTGTTGASGTGGGALTTSSGAKGARATAGIAGGGVLVAIGLRVRTAVAVLTGGGTLAASGIKRAIRTVGVSGGGLGSTSASKIASGQSTGTGGGVLAATGIKSLRIAVGIAGGGSLATVGRATRQAIALLTGGGSLLAAARRVIPPWKTGHIDAPESGSIQGADSGGRFARSSQGQVT